MNQIASVARRPRPLLLGLLCLAALAALVLPRAAAAARTGPCVPGGPTCRFWSAKVTFIADGDTIDVRVDGARRTVPIRFTGINAMELHRYSRYPSRRRGDCHAVEAVNRLEQLLRAGHMRVRLAAQHASSHSGKRLRRQVSTRIGGRWVDLNRTLVGEGHALWLPSTQEFAWNADYSALSQQAAAQGLNLWNPTGCGAGPSAGAPLRMWVRSDADGNDASNLDDEWVRIQNLDPANPVPLGGWWVRDSWLDRFTFPAGAAIPPGGTITLRVGGGSPSDTTFYWNRKKPVFENISTGHSAMGDGAYLFDPRGNVRARFVYPCRAACSEPLSGALHLDVQARRTETMTLTNVSSSPVDLYGYALEAWPRSYDFPAGTVLQPGQSLELDVGGSPGEDTPQHKHWGISQNLLRDNGGSARVIGYSGGTVTCTAWGSGVC